MNSLLIMGSVNGFAYICLTFAVRHVVGSVKVCSGVSRAGDAVVLSGLRLVSSSRTTDAPVRGGIIMMPKSTVN